MDEEIENRGRSRASLLLAILLLALMFSGGGTLVYWFLFGGSHSSPIQLETDSPQHEQVPARRESPEPGQRSASGSPLKAPTRIAAMCRDGAGNVWVGTEGQGVWRLDAAGQTWTRYTTAQGLGDNFGFAIAEDGKGRIWVGHLSHGVSVFVPTAGGAEGKWQNYEPAGGASASGTLSGPLSPRVAAIAVCPADGDVWIAGSAGLCRYSQANDNWTNLNRETGLPCDFIRRMAFDSTGNLFFATECQGVTIATAADGYKTFTTVSGRSTPPTIPRGDGLPSSLINDLLIAHDGTVYAATDAGLAWSADHGLDWQFVRGSDWAARVRGMIGGKPAGWTPTRGAILAEDTCTCLAEEPDGKILVGHSSAKGVDELDPHATKGGRIFLNCHDVSIILAAGNRKFVGTCSNGIAVSDAPIPAAPAPSAPPPAASFPTGAAPPTLTDLNRELSSLAAIPPAADPLAPTAITLSDDFRTEGAWLGRYGRYGAVLAGMLGGSDYHWGAGPTPMTYDVTAGNGGNVYRYIFALQTSNPLDLEEPPVYMDSRVKQKYTTPDKDRRPAAFNDGGWTKDRNSQGPDLYVGVDIPPGEYVLSFYFPCGGGGGVRDYLLTARPSPSADLYNTQGIDKKPVLATSRVSQWYGGWYKRFLVQGPEKVTVQIERNHAVDTSVMGVMLDLLDERPVPYYMTAAQWNVQSQQEAAKVAQRRTAWQAGVRAAAVSASDPMSAASMVLLQLRYLARWNPRAWAYCHDRIAVELTRWAEANVAADAPAEARQLKGSALYESGYYPQWEASQTALGERSARSIEKNLRWDGKTDKDSGYEFELYGKNFSTGKQNAMAPSTK